MFRDTAAGNGSNEPCDRASIDLMSPPSHQHDEDVTTLLTQLSEGDQSAMEQLLPLVYTAMHDLAASAFRGERADHTLQPTALVNEAYLRLVDQTRVTWQSRGHFLAVAATAMRRILVDHARGKSREKRAAPGVRVALDNEGPASGDAGLDVVALNESLERLAELDPEKLRVVEMRYFAGMSIEETAEAMDISPATVKRHWNFARLWLMRDMSENE